MTALLALAAGPETERLPLALALDRVCAADVIARLPNPPFARSAYDGFAVRAADTAGAGEHAPARLLARGELPAGTAPREPLGDCAAVKILTGAPVPEGADAVVPKERVRLEGDTLSVFQPLRPGDNVAPVGEDVAAGERLARRGERLDPAALGLLAGQGLDTALVYRCPRAALISTGSELAAAGVPLRAGQIYNTNLFTVGAYLRRLGAQVSDGGLVRDERDAVAAAMERALAENDAVFLTGGASVGDYDYTLSAMERLGGRVLFWRTAMKPGGAMLAAEIGGKAVIGLSGNPGAAVIGLLRVAAPFVKKLCGLRETAWPVLRLPLRDALHKASPQLRLLRGQLMIEDGAAYFCETGRQQNGAISSLSGCNLLAEVPAGSPPLPAGTPVKAYMLEGNVPCDGKEE